MKANPVSRLPNIRTKQSLFWAGHGTTGVVAALLGLAILANVFAAYYVNQEHSVYVWDYKLYWLFYRDFGSSLVQHPMDALHSLIESIQNDDYNLLPVLPLSPFAWLFGTSRLTYILAITNVALLPSALIISLLAQRILPQQFPKPSLSPPLVLATASVLMLPSMWSPVLRGFPDVLGVLVIGSILLLHFAKPLAEQRWAHLVTTGLLHCLLVLLRRYYSFWVVAFFPALTVAQCLDIYQRHDGVWKLYVATIRNAVVIGVTFTIALFVIATPLILRILHTDYSDIYSAYKSSSSLLEAAEKLFSYFGWSVIICGLVGLTWLTMRKDTRVVGSFLIMQSFIVFWLFLRTQDFSQQHYYLLIPGIALCIAVMVAGLWAQITNGLWRTVSIGFVFAALLASSVTAFYPKAANVSSILGSLVPNAISYPLIRNDLDVLWLLLDRLEELEQDQRGDIYVLASSLIMNEDILNMGCRLGPRRWYFCDRILDTHDVDKRDGFPRQFLHAQYLVVASPTQSHLKPEDQRVIGVLTREVTEGHGIGKSFQRMPGEFKLDNGVAVWVYAKIRPFERTDLEALANEFAGYYPDKRHMFITVD
jgi:hypothetical protein